MKRVLVQCDEAALPLDVRAEKRIALSLRHRGPKANLSIGIQTPSEALLAGLGERPRDLVRIAAYVYVADQSVSRSPPTDVYGDEWVRDFAVCIPVSDPDFWSQPAIHDALTAVLRFASGDRWRFIFTPASPESHQLPLELEADPSLGDPDGVSLFSGGLDSLCAVVEDSALRGGRPLLVAHSPANNVQGRQDRAIRALRGRNQAGWQFPRVGFRIHRVGNTDPADYTQRTRPFLFASLGAVIADRLGLDELVLADNGVVSLNLPINAQLLGTTTSRSTHPKVLRLFAAFSRLVLERGPAPLNPLWNRTRVETLEILRSAKAEALVEVTHSCSRWRPLPQAQLHCGTCSQCVDRRIATTAAGLTRWDPVSGYRLDLFRHALPAGTERTSVLSYVRFCPGHGGVAAR